ncbi:MAG: protease complex subunit PrcB family protein [Planctomycetota bacterium]|jgi:hypothetical protein
MNRWILSTAVALGSLTLLGSSALAGEAEILSAKVKFSGAKDAGPEAKTAAIKLKGDLRYEPELRTFDPETDRLALSIGPSTLLDFEGLPATARLKEKRDGSWSLRLRRPFGRRSSLKLDMNQVSGIFKCRAKGFEATALFASGPDGVPVSLTLGGETWEASIPFNTAAGGGRWSYSAPISVNPPTGNPNGGNGGGGGGGGGGSGGSALPFTTAYQGTWSAITSPVSGIYRDSNSWSTQWSAHLGATKPPIMFLDWTKEMFIGVWLGARSSAGYTATITKVEVSGSTITVHVTEQRPGQNCIVATVMTSPFHVIRVPVTQGTLQENLTINVQNCP